MPPRSILTAYCEEFGKLARTLADLLDVARPGVDGAAADDSAALERIAPLIERIASHIQGCRVDTAPQGCVPATRSPLGVFAVDEMCRPAVAEMCRPAVTASVSQILAGSAEEASPYTLREGPGNFADLDDEPFDPFAHGAGGFGVRTPGAAEDPDDEDDEPEDEPEEEREPLPPSRLSDTLRDEIDGRASLQGTSTSLPIQALIELIGGSKKTGMLHLRTPVEHIQFEFDRGFVVATSTDHPPPGQRLGDVLVELDFVTVDVRKAALKKARKQSKPLGAILVGDGSITVDQLSEALQFQVQSRFDRAFRAEHVAYAFVPRAHDEDDGRLRMSARELLLQSARRADEDDRPDDDEKPA